MVDCTGFVNQNLTDIGGSNPSLGSTNKSRRCGGMVDTLVLGTSPVMGCGFESHHRYKELLVGSTNVKRLPVKQ